jgi:hypothetical protein
VARTEIGIGLKWNGRMDWRMADNRPLSDNEADDRLEVDPVTGKIVVLATSSIEETAELAPLDAWRGSRGPR